MNSETAAVSRQAHELALKHGAEPDDIEQLCSREALLSILTEANIEADICEDVADTCDLSNLNALSIASGLLDTEQIAQYCFLTKDEAEVCFIALPSWLSKPLRLLRLSSLRTHLCLRATFAGLRRHIHNEIQDHLALFTSRLLGKALPDACRALG